MRAQLGNYSELMQSAHIDTQNLLHNLIGLAYIITANCTLPQNEETRDKSSKGRQFPIENQLSSRCCNIYWLLCINPDGQN